MTDVLDDLDRACRDAGCTFRAYANTATDCAWEGIVLITENRAADYGDGSPTVCGGRSAGMATAEAAVGAAARAAISALARRAG